MDYICNLVRECNQDDAWFVSCFLPCSVTGVWSSCSQRRSSRFTWTKFFWTSTTSWRLFLKSCSNRNPMIWLIAPSERFYTHCTNSSAPGYSTSYLSGLVQYFCEDFFIVLESLFFFFCCDLLTLDYESSESDWERQWVWSWSSSEESDEAPGVLAEWNGKSSGTNSASVKRVQL